MINENFPLSELTSKIIGCAIEVHKFLGNGFQEKIYQRALYFEMQDQGLHFAREKEMQVFYKQREVGTRRVDFFVEQQVMVELKPLLHWKTFIWHKPLIISKRTKWKSDSYSILDQQNFKLKE